MRSERLKRLLISSCGLLAGVSPVAAQPGTGPASAPPVPAAAGGAVSDIANSISSARASRELARIASLDLQVTGGVSPRDYRVTSLLLGLAHELNPNDETILRLLVDAASSAGDREQMMEYTRALLRLNPADTVVQLRLISGGISSRQDADSRLEGYERFLNYKDGKGVPLDASIRSRLALDAALLLRERGDMRGFAEKLSQATELDPTNKDAASLAVTFYTEQSPDPVGRLVLLINLLKADPFDPSTHLAIARELASGEAVLQSGRFYQTYGMLLRTRGEQMPTSISAETTIVTWADKGPMEVVSQLRDSIERSRAGVRAQRELAIEQDRPLSELPDPERVRLTPELERVRFAAALASGDEGQADYAYQDLVRTYELGIRMAQDRTQLPANTTEQAILEAVRLLRSELMWVRLMSGRDVPLAEEVLTELKQDDARSRSAEADAAMRRLDGWLLLQKGELDKAEQTLTPLAETDLLARLGLSVLEERRGNAPEAIKRYEKLARDAAGSLIGAYARTRYGVLSGSPLPRLPMATELEKLAAAVPTWLEEMIADPHRIASLQVTVEPSRIGPLDPARVRVRLRNISPIPLALGPEKPLNSRLLLVPAAGASMLPVPAATGVLVVRMDQKLRLLPQEQVDMMVWADQGNLGWILNRVIVAPVTVKWKAIQGFVMTPQGLYVQGPQCVTSETDYLQRGASAKTYQDVDTLAKWAQTGTSEDVAELVLLTQVHAQVKEDERRTWPAEQRAKVGEALAERYPRLDTASRMMVAAMLPLAVDAPWLKPVEDAIAADTDPRVTMIALAVRVGDEKDPRLASALASGNAKLAEMASLVSSRLRDGTTTYATLKGSGVTIVEEPPKPQSPIVNP